MFFIKQLMLYSSMVIDTIKRAQLKVNLGTAEGDFKQQFQNYKKSFRNQKYETETSLSKHIWEMKDKHNISPNLMWSIVKSVPGYSNISKRSNTRRDVCCVYMKSMKS